MKCATHEVIDFESSRLAPSQARRVVRRTVSPLVSADVTDTAELLVSELVTNAVIHGSGTVRLIIDLSDHCLSVTVSDLNPVAPKLAPEQLLADGGRGLRMIASLAGSWGVRLHVDAPGKDVWFQLP